MFQIPFASVAHLQKISWPTEYCRFSALVGDSCLSEHHVVLGANPRYIDPGTDDSRDRTGLPWSGT